MNKALELVIDEPTEGHFFWTLINMTRPGEKPLVVDFAMGPLPSRAAAVAAGNASLHRNKTGGWEVPGQWGGQFAETVPAQL
jgi:hypothetical protein